MPKNNNNTRKIKKRIKKKKYYKHKNNISQPKSNDSNNNNNKSKINVVNLVKQQLHLIINDKSQDPREIQSKCYNLIKYIQTNNTHKQVLNRMAFNLIQQKFPNHSKQILETQEKNRKNKNGDKNKNRNRKKNTWSRQKKRRSIKSSYKKIKQPNCAQTQQSTLTSDKVNKTEASKNQLQTNNTTN